MTTPPLYRDPRALALVFVGGTFGTLARAGLGELLADVTFVGHRIPTATTIVVNLAGAFLIGGLAGFLAGRSSRASRRFYLVASTGFLGAFTTYSAFVAGALPVAIRGGASSATAVPSGTALSSGAVPASSAVPASGNVPASHLILNFDLTWQTLLFPVTMLVAGVVLAYVGLVVGRRLAPSPDAEGGRL
ncbi:CrcB family protein [Arcanobacterium haemolyticum]|nr:CrcB family protein [Arcanobacterium haemolyticum]